MLFARLGPPGAERPVALSDAGRIHDLSRVCTDIDAAFLEGGVPAARAALDAGTLPEIGQGNLLELGKGTLSELGEGPARWGAPIARPGKIVGIGLNYRDHARESGAEPPGEPIVFLKASSSICGPQDDIRPVPGSTSTDWEVELGVVLGRRLRGESDPRRALDAVAGYVAANDVSDRELQLERGGTWTKGKSADTFCPVGPWLVTPDQAGDPQQLALRLWVNGRLRQDGCTSEMVFGVGELLSYVSQVMTLEPGDLLLTGTPAGVALGQPEPRPYLRHGDVVELEVQGLGIQRTPVVAVT